MEFPNEKLSAATTPDGRFIAVPTTTGGGYRAFVILGRQAWDSYTMVCQTRALSADEAIKRAQRRIGASIARMVGAE